MRQTGRATVDVNGDVLATKSKGASIKIGGPKRDDFMTDQGEATYKEMLEPAECKAKLVHVLGTDLAGLRTMVDGTVGFETDTGQSWVIRGAYTKSIGELSDGEVEVTFGGAPAERVA